MKQMLRLGIILAAYAVASCLLLAVVNNFTAPVIKARQEEKVNGGLKIVYSAADSFETVTDYEVDPSSTISVDRLVLAKKNGEVIGAVAQVTGPTYDKATILMGIDKNRTITGIQFIEHSDTKGFGLNASDPSYKISTGQTFYEQFAGKNANDGFVAGTNFEAVTGATITSRGVGKILEYGSYVAGEYLAKNYGGASGNGAPKVEKAASVFTFEDAIKDIFDEASYGKVTTEEVSDGVGETLNEKLTVQRKVLVKNADGTVIAAATEIEGPSFGGKGKAVTAVSMDRKILGTRITSLNDTPNLGQEAIKEAFYSQFTGKSADQNLNKGDYDTLSGASTTADCIADIIKVGAYVSGNMIEANGGEKSPANASSYILNKRM